MDSDTKEQVLAIARLGHSRSESTDYFRVALGLLYLAGLMTPETIDFKRVDRDFNRFIYQSIGKGHSITSVLQFMSGAKVVPVVQAPRFLDGFAAHCPSVPIGTIAFLLSLNLGVAKNISRIDIGGPLLDWIEGQKTGDAAGAAGAADAADSSGAAGATDVVGADDGPAPEIL